MTKISKRLLASVLTVAVLLSCISTTVFAAEESPNEPLHNHSEQSDLDDLAFVNGTACYVQYDLNSDGVLSGKDAVELLGRATMSDIYQGGLTEEYDLDKDGDFDADDALALLKIALWHPEDYKGNIHAFSGNPVWSWNDNGEAVAEFRCACGEKTAKLNADLQEPVVEDATCTEAGSVKTTASVEFLGKTYTDTKTVISPATGHTYMTEASCTESAECSKCGYVLPAAGHNYKKTAEQAASCTTEATETYTCTDCGDVYTVKTGDKVHTYVYYGEEPKEGETCVYVRKLKCACGEETYGEEVKHHEYKAAITKEATCSEAGVKTYTCTKCKDYYTEEIPVSAEGHNWVETDKQNGVVSYRCNNCDKTKSVVVATDNTVDVTALENGGEVQLDNDVSVTLDKETTEQLNGQLTLNVSKVEDKNSIQIADEYKDSSTIYSLTMTDEKGSVTEFAGEVTVRLPYTLQEGDDVDCIKVLYVNDVGEVKEIEGHYSNGYVIFTTNHFSYYTVTRLTPAQRCALYGHNDKVTEVEATCENGGYTVKYCARCTRVEKTDETAALGHDYTVTEAEATCTKAGSITKKCSRCDSALTENYPAIGHNWEIETVAATCVAPGEEIKTCSVCGEEQTKILPQLGHKITDTVVPATCTDNGYTLHECDNCAYSVTDSAVAAKGHTYKAEWVWDESNYSARVTLTCDDCGDTVTADAAVAEVVDLATCTEGGTEAFEASYSHAGKVYTDSINIKLDPLGHDFGDWEDNGENHIHICGRCEAEETEDHIWDEGKITKEPTCGTEGNIRKNCRVCSVKKDFAIPATGEHNFENGICTECGYNENDCNHYSEDCEFTEIETVDLSKHGFCGGILHIEICPCGKVHRDWYEYTDMCCEWYRDSESYTEKEDGSGFISEDTFTCDGCGATRVSTYDTTYISADSCDEIDVYTQTYRSAAGKEFSISEQNYYEDCHRTEQKFKLLGSSCGEGVFEQNICKHCGKVLYEETYYEHNTYANIERIKLPDSTCGGEYYINSCACGQVIECENYERCNWTEIESDEEAEIFTHKCDKCNTIMVVEYGEEESDDCHGSRNFYVTMFNTSGEKIFDRTFEIKGLNHDFETDVALKGESCEDGYTVTKTCSKCGTVERVENNSHNTSILDEEIIDLYKHGFCGGTLHIRSCPCGAVSGDYYEFGELGCYWNRQSSETEQKPDGSGYIQTTKQVCYNCDAECIETRDVTYNSADSCDAYVIVTNVYRNADGEEFTIKNENDDYDSHNIEITYTLLGESCEDGVRCREFCRHCNSTLSEYTYYDHRIFNKETVELPDSTCGGRVGIQACLCGQESHYYENTRCRWEYYGYDDITNESKRICHECNAVWTEKYECTALDECHELCKRSIKISDASGEVIVDHTFEYVDTNHTYVYSAELYGDTCEDGYEVYATCKYCGYKYSYYSSGHYGSMVETETINLAEHGFCGGILHIRTCACGLVRDDNFEHSEGSCSFGWNSNQEVYTAKEDGSGYILTRNMHCHNCDAECIETRDVTYYSADSCEAYVVETNVYRSADGEQFTTRRDMNLSGYHDTETTYTPLGESCEDGVLCRETCRRCNRTVNEYTYYNHRTFDKETVELPDSTCGGQIGIRACLCGEESYYYEDTNCRWEYYGYDDISKESRRICHECNAVWKEKYEYTELDKCHGLVKRSIKISDASGEVIVDHTFEYVDTNHTYVYSAELHGDTCEDGYEVHATCKYCGYVNSYLSYGHYGIRIEQNTVDLSEHGFCGGIIHILTCPCGLVRYEEYTDVRCRWSGGSQEDITTEKSDGSGYIRTRTMHCDNCSAVRTETQDVTYKNDYNCEVTVVETNTFRNADGEEFTTSRSFDGSGWHLNKRTYEMLGESCEDGVTYKDICSHCGQITFEETYYNHRPEYNEIIELPDTTCGGHYAINSCVCGESVNYYDNTRCNWQSTGYDSDTDTRSFTCSECGATKTERDIPSETQAPCYYFNQRHITILDSDGTTVLDRDLAHKGTNHDYCVVSANAEGGNCENGFTVELQCDKCGKTITKTGNSHQAFVTRIDLSLKGACEGTYLELHACACGSEKSANVYMYGCNTRINNSEIKTNDDGTVSWSDTIVCRDCGLRSEYTYVGEREDGSCEIIGTVKHVITLNGEVIYEDADSFITTEHESTHYVYEEGLSCTDGIEYQEVCDRCNEVVSIGTVSDHNTILEVEEIDLGECGAACGGKLTVKSCICGERQYARLENGDYCDFDRQDCELWVDDAIELHDRYNAEYNHYEYVGSDAYDMLCAVSDPQACGFRIRVADYWRAVPDNPCLLQNVQIWRIGYDIETDTWQREITVLGRIVSEHDFTLTEENTVNDLGQEVNVTTRTCKNCDTTATHETIRQNVEGSSLIIKETHTFTNRLDKDDLNKARTTIYEYIAHGTHTHIIFEYMEVNYKNGGEYWGESSYTYNFDECTRNYENTNSNGYHSADSKEYHCWEYLQTTIKSPTCSQFGERLYGVCGNCGKQNIAQISPHQHNWWFDFDRGIYYCNYCGLESATGANGSIVMEDLTASHGNETDFVIGYWNRNDIPVSYYVSVVLNELGEDAENDRVLQDIAFTELNREENGITAISFNKEETLNKAKELVESLNYSGSYDIRFTFVPQYDDTTLDYAITLTGVTE